MIMRGVCVCVWVWRCAEHSQKPPNRSGLLGSDGGGSGAVMAPVDLHAAPISRNDTARRAVPDGLRRPLNMHQDVPADT